MRYVQITEAETGCQEASGFDPGHSAVRGYSGWRDTRYRRVGSSSGLDGSHVGDTSGKQSERRKMANVGRTPTLRSVGSSACVNPTSVSSNPREPTDWRAVCGKIARTVRREGRPKPIGRSYPYPRRVLRRERLRVRRNDDDGHTVSGIA